MEKERAFVFLMLGKISVLAGVLVIGVFYSFASMRSIDIDIDPNFIGSRMVTRSIPFKGAATGGELIVADTLNRNMAVTVINTNSGIALPADSESITVWLRLAAQAAGEVGFDWIKLEDLGRIDD